MGREGAPTATCLTVLVTVHAGFCVESLPLGASDSSPENSEETNSKIKDSLEWGTGDPEKERGKCVCIYEPEERTTSGLDLEVNSSGNTFFG